MVRLIVVVLMTGLLILGVLIYRRLGVMLRHLRVLTWDHPEHLRLWLIPEDARPGRPARAGERRPDGI
jgi:hypothetical protein